MKRRDFFKLGAATGAVLTGRGAEAKHQDLLGTEGSYRWGRDLALVNAKILTLETNPPQAEAVLVRRGRIVAVGSNEDVRARTGGARVFDAGGQVVVPGFIDAHCHIEVAALSNATPRRVRAHRHH